MDGNLAQSRILPACAAARGQADRGILGRRSRFTVSHSGAIDGMRALEAMIACSPRKLSLENPMARLDASGKRIQPFTPASELT